jgi:hypothetical protein
MPNAQTNIHHQKINHLLFQLIPISQSKTNEVPRSAVVPSRSLLTVPRFAKSSRTDFSSK